MAIVIENTGSVIYDTPSGGGIFTIPHYYHPGGLMVVEVSTEGPDNPEVGGVFYGSEGLLNVMTVNGGSVCETTLWFATPPAGGDDVQIDIKTNTLTVKAAVYSISGYNPVNIINTTAEDNFDVGEGNSLPITPTVDGCLIIEGCTTYDGTLDPMTFDPFVYSNDDGGNCACSQYYLQPTATTKNMDFGWSGETYYAHAAIAIEPEPPPPSATNHQFFLSLT